MADPPSESEKCDGVLDIAPPPSDETVAFPTYPTDSDDQGNDGVFEVYGPPEKRPRLSAEINTDDGSDGLTVPALQQRPLVPEEDNIRVPSDRMQVATSHTIPTPSTKLTVPDEASPLTLKASIATTTAISSDDDPNEVVKDLTPSDPGDPIVTQDEDMISPDILESITRQLTRGAEDSASDELFSLIEGHEWHDGALHFRVKWTTNEVSTIPFALMTRDYPTKTAS